MSNIEPTEEQKQAARELTGHHMVGKLTRQRIVNADDIARLLAEREAKLREELRGEWARLVEAREVTAMIVEGHQLRARVAELEDDVEAAKTLMRLAQKHGEAATARVAELEAKIADAVFSCPGCGRHDFGFFASQIKAACGPCRTRAEAAEEREAQHLARIAELEAKAANLDARLWDRCEDLARVGLERVHADAVHSKREAQHLADIKALHQFLGDHEEEEGIWIPRSEFKDVPCRKYLAHYDDAKADAGAVCRPDDNACGYCSMCKASTEGGAR